MKTESQIGLKIRLLSLLWCTVVFLLSPFILILAIYTKNKTPRLPEAGGEPKGIIKLASPCAKVSLLFLGESPVAGVGVDSYNQSLAAESARSFSKIITGSVSWAAIGKNGITIEQSIDELLPKVSQQPIDFVIIMLGVNDVTSLKSLKHWHQSIDRLIINLKKLTKAKILFYGSPPLGQFPALPKTLALVAGSRAALFDLVTKNHPLNGVEYFFSPFRSIVSPEHFAEDGYHPSKLGCVALGKRVAEDLQFLLDEH